MGVLTNPLELTQIRVEGHTDNAGAAAANLALSQARVEEVAGVLISLGIDAERIAAAGFGEAHPVADHNTTAGRAANRQVEIHAEKCLLWSPSALDPWGGRCPLSQDESAGVWRASVLLRLQPQSYITTLLRSALGVRAGFMPGWPPQTSQWRGRAIYTNYGASLQCNPLLDATKLVPPNGRTLR